MSVSGSGTGASGGSERSGEMDRTDRQGTCVSQRFLQRGDQTAVSPAGRGLCQSCRDGSGFCTAKGSVGVACYLPS